MSSSRDIQGHLQKVAERKNTRERLVFDPTTGKLRVVYDSADDVVCADMAASGFSGNLNSDRIDTMLMVNEDEGRISFPQVIINQI